MGVKMSIKRQERYGIEKSDLEILIMLLGSLIMALSIIFLSGGLWIFGVVAGSLIVVFSVTDGLKK